MFAFLLEFGKEPYRDSKSTWEDFCKLPGSVSCDVIIAAVTKILMAFKMDGLYIS